MNLAEMLTTRYSYSLYCFTFFLRSDKRFRSDGPPISPFPSNALCHETTSKELSVGEIMDSLLPKLF